MAHTLYSNEVLGARLKDLLSTKINAKNLMTIDTSLTEAAGMIKKINTYSYAATVEKLAKGAKNADASRGVVSYTSASYTVKANQQVFDYADEEAMTDPKVVEYGMNGASTVMVNSLVADYFTELAKATLSQTYAKGGKISYDTIVDAIAKMNLEDESDLFIIIGTDLKADIRKDDDFVNSRQGEIVHSGEIGNICGVPVIVSKKCPTKTAYVATKEAVTYFTKKEAEVEQSRDIETRTNTVAMRNVCLVALTDATKVVKITEATA